MNNEEIIKTVRRIRNASAAQVEELDRILKQLDPAPTERKRKNLKDRRIEQFETNYTLGTWKKPRK